MVLRKTRRLFHGKKREPIGCLGGKVSNIDEVSEQLVKRVNAVCCVRGRRFFEGSQEASPFECGFDDG